MTRPRPYVSGRPVRRCELRTARCSGVYSEKTHWLWVRRHPSSSSNARRISGESSAPRSAHARSASLRPPQGFTPRTSGASVWRPTTTSSRVGCTYAGACEVMVHGLLASTPRHPPAAASRASSAWHAPHSAAVFSVGPASEPRRSASAGTARVATNAPTSGAGVSGRDANQGGSSEPPEAAMTRAGRHGERARRTGRGSPRARLGTSDRPCLRHERRRVRRVRAFPWRIRDGAVSNKQRKRHAVVSAVSASSSLLT